MKVFNRAEDLHIFVKELTKNQNSIGFVPTMGALHEGHLALVKKSLQDCSQTICSIFLNPTQFNEPSDLEKYPKTPQKDIEKLKGVGCELVFLPPVEEIYPNGLNNFKLYDLDGLDQRLEGQYRPGHFQGVAQVVHRLLDIVGPDFLYMGQKDYQQVSVVRKMIEKEALKVEVVMFPTQREKDGLAMSSRNRRLDPEIRGRVPMIYQTLQWLQRNWSSMNLDELKKACWDRLDLAPLRPEYFEIVDGHSLLPIKEKDNHDQIVACTAVWAGDVRLIDNLVLKGVPNLKSEKHNF